MNLDEYLKSEGKSLTEFSAEIKKPVSTVHGWISKRRNPRLRDLQIIETATNGQVKAQDFMDPAPGQEAA